MAYDKQTWANGDVVTANKLNHMEDGIANNECKVAMVATTCDAESSTTTIQMKASELLEIMKHNLVVLQNAGEGVGMEHGVYSVLEEYTVDPEAEYQFWDSKNRYTAATANDYPTDGGVK